LARRVLAARPGEMGPHAQSWLMDPADPRPVRPQHQRDARPGEKRWRVVYTQLPSRAPPVRAAAPALRRPRKRFRNRDQPPGTTAAGSLGRGGLIAVKVSSRSKTSCGFFVHAQHTGAEGGAGGVHAAAAVKPVPLSRRVARATGPGLSSAADFRLDAGFPFPARCVPPGRSSDLSQPTSGPEKTGWPQWRTAPQIWACAGSTGGTRSAALHARPAATTRNQIGPRGNEVRVIIPGNAVVSRNTGQAAGLDREPAAASSAESGSNRRPGHRRWPEAYSRFFPAEKGGHEIGSNPHRAIGPSFWGRDWPRHDNAILSTRGGI